MTIGTQIALLRKRQNITQETLAQQLGVTNQAVSKWESDQCCPDVMLLPKIADIFGISIDELFGRPAPKAKKAESLQLPWADDETVRAVVFVGRRLIDGHPAAKEMTFEYEGPALNVDSAFSVSCGDVEGNISAGSTVNCGDVDGNIVAGGNVNCGDIAGNLKAGGNVNCGDVDGDVNAGGMASCGDVTGSINSGKDIMARMWKSMMPREE